MSHRSRRRHRPTTFPSQYHFSLNHQLSKSRLFHSIFFIILLVILFPLIPNSLRRNGCAFSTTEAYPIYIQTLNNDFYRLTEHSQLKMRYAAEEMESAEYLTRVHQDTASSSAGQQQSSFGMSRIRDPSKHVVSTVLHNTTAAEYFLASPFGKLYFYENKGWHAATSSQGHEASVSTDANSASHGPTSDISFHRYSASPLDLVDWIRFGKPWSKNGFYYHSRMNSSYLLLDVEGMTPMGRESNTESHAPDSLIHEYSRFPSHPFSSNSPHHTIPGSTTESPLQLQLFHIHYTLDSHHYHDPQYTIHFHDYYVLRNEDEEWSPEIDQQFTEFYSTLSNQLHMTRMATSEENEDSSAARKRSQSSKNAEEHIIYQFDSIPIHAYIYVPSRGKFFKKKLDVAVPPQIYQPTSVLDEGVVLVRRELLQQDRDESDVLSRTGDVAHTSIPSEDCHPEDDDDDCHPLNTDQPQLHNIHPPEEMYHIFPIPQDAKLINYPLPQMDFHPAQLKLLPTAGSNDSGAEKAKQPDFKAGPTHKIGLHALRRFKKFESLPSFERLPMISSGEYDASRALSIYGRNNREDRSAHHPLLLEAPPGMHPPPSFLSRNLWWILLILIASTAMGMFLFYKVYTKSMEEMERKRKQELDELEANQKILLNRQRESLQKKMKESIEKHSRIKETEKVKTIGNLTIHKTRIIGRGSQGTVVYSGELSHRKVAVKRMLKEFHEHIHNEISILIESDEHAHVVRYFAKEEDDLFIYLALELCPCTLDEAIEMHQEGLESTEEGDEFSLNKSLILSQLARAVQHIHSLNIVHRDIKPQNVLLDSNYHIKLSDMGLGKKIDRERSSFTMGSLYRGAGSIGWHAPEVFQQQNKQKNSSQRKSSNNNNSSGIRLTKKIDIFSLGCVMYYVLTDGEHPYGEPSHRESNIMYGKYNLKHIDHYPGYVKHLIKKMIEPDPEKRYTIEQVLEHPYFWDANKKLSFLSDVSDQLGKEKEQSVVYKELERKKRQITGVTSPKKNWSSKLDAAIVNGVLKFRKYDFDRVWDLLRLIRNIRAHYREYDENLKKLLAPYPEGIYEYFSFAFPDLFSTVYGSVSRHWRDREVFQQYFS